jgi:hypothetical protein
MSQNEVGHSTIRKEDDKNREGGQKREFVRVDDVLPLSWRKMDPVEYKETATHFDRYGEFPVKNRGIESIIASLDVSDKLKVLERTDPHLSRVLGRLDMKLNLLLRLFHPKETEQPLVPTPVNLSGGGIALWAKDHDLAVDDALDMRLALAVDGLVSIECYVRVVRIFPKNRGDLDKIACVFAPVMPADRERMIQYIFQRQAEMLRLRKVSGGHS